MAGDILSDTGTAISDLYAASGASDAATSYAEAARIARENAAISRAATATRNMQIERGNIRILGEQAADIGGAGFAASGTALDLMRASHQEGEITRVVNEEQGAIQANAYEEQALQFASMEASANASAKGLRIAGMISAGGAIYGAASLIGGLAGATYGGAAAAGASGAGTEGAADLIGTTAAFA
jgi:hypothetical protein